MDEVKKRYYTVQDIKKLENCGRDKAYEIASNLPHEKRGRQIFVFAEDYEKYYEQKRELALRERENCEKKELNNIYQIKKFS
nr:MAG TPA: excisionase [Caudoviricetes sp.]